jgi:hypothetical protein
MIQYANDVSTPFEYRYLICVIPTSPTNLLEASLTVHFLCYWTHRRLSKLSPTGVSQFCLGLRSKYNDQARGDSTVNENREKLRITSGLRLIVDESRLSAKCL